MRTKEKAMAALMCLLLMNWTGGNAQSQLPQARMVVPYEEEARMPEEGFEGDGEGPGISAEEPETEPGLVETPEEPSIEPIEELPEGLPGELPEELPEEGGTQALDEPEVVLDEELEEAESTCFLQYVPASLLFHSVEISQEVQLVSRQDPIWMIQVMDTLGEEEIWQLYASAEDLVSEDGEDLLDGMLVFITGGSMKPLSSLTGRALIAGKSPDAVPGQATLIWQEDEGPQLYLSGNAGIPGKQYTTTITWSLEIGP